MKKLIYILLSAGLFTLAACKGGATQQTGNAVADSGSAGSSGASDTSSATGAGSPAGVSAGGTDTSHNANGSANPSIDTTTPRPPH